MCRSGNVNYPGNRNNKEKQNEIGSEIQETEPDPVAFTDFTSENGWEEYHIDNFLVMAISEAFEIKQATTLSEDDLNGHIIKLKTKTEDLFAIADCGSPMSFLNEKTARRLEENDNSVIIKQIPPDDTARNLACYNGDTIVPKGRLIIMIESGGWKIQAAPFIIVDNQKANIIGKNTLPQLGIRLIQEKPKQKKVLDVRDQEQSNSELKQRVKDNYPQPCFRVGKSKNHVMRTQFNKEFVPVQQKGRRVPVHLQERVGKELNKLMDQKQTHRKIG